MGTLKMARLIGKYRNNKPIPTEKEENKLRMIHEQEPVPMDSDEDEVFKEWKWVEIKHRCKHIVSQSIHYDKPGDVIIESDRRSKLLCSDCIENQLEEIGKDYV
jgi:formylmethanofuran dehydrogenase subunit E